MSVRRNAVFFNWWVVAQTWAADPFWMGCNQLVKKFFLTNTFNDIECVFYFEKITYFERHALTLTDCVARGKMTKSKYDPGGFKMWVSVF